MCRSRMIATLVTVLIEVSCATAALSNPFKVAENEFYGKIKTIALAPIVVLANPEDPEPVKAKFESLIEARLREAGFSVVPSREVGTTWKRMSDLVGGIFDPVTGQRDESKFKTVREHVLRELNAKLNVDALLHPRIQPVTARLFSGFFSVEAKWHGASESVSSFCVYGSARALSLFVTIEDVHGVNLYVNAGGIQLLETCKVGQGIVPVPRHELFANEERNGASVSIALGPLIQRPASTGGP